MWRAAALDWGAAVRDLSNLVFMLLLPALLFRTMSAVHLEQLDFKPIAMYFGAAALVYALVIAVRATTPRARCWPWPAPSATPA
jgi:predicted permease